MLRFIIATSWNEAAISRQFRSLALELARRGHRVVLIVPGRKLDLVDRAGNPALETWPSVRPTGVRDFLFLFRTARRERPDVMIANFGASNVMMVVGSILGVPLRLDWYHTMAGAIEMDAPMRPLRVRFLRWRKRWVYRMATHVVAVSEAASRDVRQVYGIPESKLRVVYNALADPLAGQPTAGDKRDVARILCVGRLDPSKGQDVLIRAVAILKRSGTLVDAEFIGEGPSRGAYINLARQLGVEDVCHFPGSLRHEEVIRRMSRSGVVVVASRGEAFGLAAVESMAVGTPVVAAGVGGLPEVVRDGIDGIVVAPEDPAALAEGLSRLFHDAELRARMGKDARARFLATFEMDRAIAALADSLESYAGPRCTQ